MDASRRRERVDVIFNFSRYDDLKQAVIQLVRDNIDPDSLYEEAQVYLNPGGNQINRRPLNDDVKRRTGIAMARVWNLGNETRQCRSRDPKLGYYQCHSCVENAYNRISNP